MNLRLLTLCGAAAALLACQARDSDRESANAPMAQQAAPAQEPAPAASPPATEEPAPPVLNEPRGPIDPKSVEAAGQVVQHYGALIEQGRWAEAAKLWGDSDAAASFARKLGDREVHLEIGDLGPAEGAAGSIYTTVPVTFYGPSYRRPADIILKRVNDVPGSTEAQRRWHIERIELRQS